MEYVSQTKGIPVDRLLVVNQHIRGYPLLQRQLWGITILDQVKDGKFYQVLVDVEMREILDPSEIEMVERQAYIETYGKLSPDLHTHLTKTDIEETVPVIIQLKIPDLASIEAQLASSGIKEPEQIRQMKMDLFKQYFSTEAKALASSLEQQGHLVYVADYLPFLAANLSPSLIDNVATRSDVAMIYLANEHSVPEMDIAVQTDRVQDVWNMGFDGSGVDIAILEDGAVDVDSRVPLNVIATRLSEPSSGHSTLVASVAAAIPGAWLSEQGTGVESEIGEWFFTLINLFAGGVKAKTCRFSVLKQGETAAER